ncbi:DUF6263 family protein [Flagellimonas allohymeniacidonis]|uniref:Uncharacterized protein n=1 Tax=Flagellimonas allohymeniacidonis TaxID=2517819 RepID=A0A4Q8QFG5_9FLAO|nr:DUF6263 family protein [Allomuricauda hymeniacidonis]TAI49171.1 hypothetical protein EW142_05070 [Allomuricauda hymeniacidonis]
MTLQKPFAFAFLLAALVIFSQNIWAQQSLSYKLAKGEVFSIKQNAKQLIVQELEGTKHEMTNDLDAIFTFTVMEKTEEGFAINLTFQDFGLKSNSSIQGELFNVRASEPIEGDLMSQMFAGLVGYELQITMRNDGKILEVNGGNELVEKMVTAANIEDEFTRNLMKKSLAKEFSSNGLAKSFEQMTYFYPQTEVNIGDTWETVFEGKMQAKNLWKWERQDSDSAYITGTSTIVLKTDENGTVMSLDGTQESSIETTLSTGFIKKINSSSLAKGISIMANMKGVEIPTSIQSDITYEIIQ